MSNLMIELHLIQNFAPSCLNRDVTNTPKDCEFGGVRRARISSQCIKRSTRLCFRDKGIEDIGKRTKLLKSELARRLSDLGRPEQLSAALDAFLETYYSKMDAQRPDQTAVLLYLAEPEIAEAAQCVREIWNDLSAVAEARGGAQDGSKRTKGLELKQDKQIAERLRRAGLSADVALFGRMLAENPEMNVEAACQVAHAISTHRVDMDLDFYTAVDDLNPASETGAGMMGETGFNSACFYRYSVIDRNQLIANLGGDEKLADTVIRAFIEASVEAIPTGKQNSFAAHNKPDFGMIVVRKNGAPCSLANAFATPIRIKPGSDEDLIGLSIESLCSLYPKMKQVYGDGGVVHESIWHLGHGDRLGEMKQADRKSMTEAVDAAMAAVARAASEV